MLSQVKHCIAVMVSLAMLAMVVGPAAASAGEPEVPHGDENASNWLPIWATDMSGADCFEQCSFDAVGEGGWNWRIFPGSQYEDSAECGGPEMSGFMVASGVFLVSDAYWSTSGPAWCYHWGAGELPWWGKACMHNPTGSIWVRQQIGITERQYAQGTSYEGITFGELRDFGSGTWKLEFDDADTGISWIPWLEDHRHSVQFTGIDGFNVKNDEEHQEGCDWPELA